MSVQVAFWHHFLPEGSLAGVAPAPSFYAHPRRHTVSPLPAELGVPSLPLSSLGPGWGGWVCITGTAGGASGLRGS